MEKQLQAERPIQAVFNEVMANEPKPFKAFTPINAGEQKTLFLNGEIENPKYTYGILETIDFAAVDEKLASLEQEISEHSAVNSKFSPVYEAYIARHRAINELMMTSYQLKNPQIEADWRAELEARFMELNIELYGAPEYDTYKGLVSEAKTTIAEKPLQGRAAELREELFAVLPENAEATERFKPSAETFSWVKEVAEALYGNMLAHVPERDEKFSPAETRDLFAEIVRSEFGEAADGWRLVITDEVKSISVVASETTIKIPITHKPIGYDDMRGLVAHELGVHLLRAVEGSQADLLPMRLGFAGYADAEEGLGRAMEQAIKGEFKDAGIPPYLASGLMYYEQKDFRETHETLWRYLALESLEEADVTDEKIEKVQDRTYRILQRIGGGEGTLPWFKDLSYYNGSTKVWQYLEEVRGDDLQFPFLFMGKADATQKAHERIMYETRTV